uniref:Uncharacterized protein n=1 Tax=Oryza punctata TaxID=4537 RepID=A0A0E0LJI8_ORYPU
MHLASQQPGEVTRKRRRLLAEAPRQLGSAAARPRRCLGRPASTTATTMTTMTSTAYLGELATTMTGSGETDPSSVGAVEANPSPASSGEAGGIVSSR